MHLPLRSVLVALLALLAVGPAAAQARVTVGIADQKADMFSDPRFASLGMRNARVVVPYDVLADRARLAQLDAWMAGARAGGIAVLVTFDRSTTRRGDPTAGQMAAAVRGLRARYRGLREFATWNEANLGRRPELVAGWWLAMRRACPTCTILGADLLDRPNIAVWAARFVKAAKRTPAVWGLHNYVDANRLTTNGTRKLLKAVRGEIWFTETGGIVARDNGSSVRFPTSAPHAATATRFLFSKLVTLSPRIRRIYLYHWNTGVGEVRTWDSGLVGPDDAERPALAELRRILGRPAPAAPTV